MKTILVIMLACAAAACASNAGGGREALSSLDNDGSFNLSPLGDGALPPGKCGMVLWTLDANAPTRILKYIAGESATISVNGAPVLLTLAEASGSSNYGVSERQVFVGGAGYDAIVRVSFGMGFDGGTYLERGLITVKSQNGWEIVAPTAGIAGCRRK